MAPPAIARRRAHIRIPLRIPPLNSRPPTAMNDMESTLAEESSAILTTATSPWFVDLVCKECNDEAAFLFLDALPGGTMTLCSPTETLMCCGIDLSGTLRLFFMRHHGLAEAEVTRLTLLLQFCCYSVLFLLGFLYIIHS
ncbi:unnamed protein product [Pieris macdunnoughi]|uniref:Uncharacterized protein n=1 Tax=Pieris macdunnoughi TaxID=345717 RepID=A0A821SKN3_9NEOP|nr:unnamed protein product [Pieris macdunnoughi]